MPSIILINKSRLLALFAGMLLPLAFAPFDLTWFAIASPALLLPLWVDTQPREAFRRGWWFGLGFFGVGASWIYVSIYQYGNTGLVLAVLLTFLFVAFLALFPALQGYLLQTLTFYKRQQHVSVWALIYFPITWVFVEWMRSWILTGFPWLLLGHSQVDSYLGGFAPIVGVFGVTAIVTCLSGLVYLLVCEWIQKKYRVNWRTCLVFIVVIFLLGAFLKTIVWTTKEQPALRVALVQGNIPQALKWSPTEVEKILRWYPKLSESLWKRNDLVIWPEAAITLPLPWSSPYLNRLLELIKHYPVSLITGIPAQGVNGFQYYNSMLLLGRTGNDIYYKRYLVPFGEYVPLEQYLRGLIGFFNLPMSDFISGSIRGDNTLQNHQSFVVAPFVCYEIAYPEAILTTAPKSNLMVVLSNDTWFGNSLGPYQHLQIAQFAALVSGRYILVSTNDGITAVIDNQGKILAKAPRFEAAVLESRVFLTQGNTPWVSWVHRYVLLCLGLILIIVRIR